MKNGGLSDAPQIERWPAPEQVEVRSLSELPTQDLESSRNWQVDVHSADLSGLDLSSRLRDLLFADFDSRTLWPQHLPQGFDPGRVMELGGNPGLGLRTLHQSGIDGRNIGIGIMDAHALYLDHQEYRDRIRFYQEIQPNQQEARIHFSMVVSAASGRTVGVAPGADLYVVAFTPDFRPPRKAGDRPYATHIAQALDRLRELNESLPRQRTIRVIVCPLGFQPGSPYTEMVLPAIERARRAGIFVVSCSVDETYRDQGISFNETIGMGRAPMADPDRVESYGPAYHSEKDFRAKRQPLQRLLVPMDSRTLASATGPADYFFVRHGGSSWVAPYIAGLYALCCQVRPKITPGQFFRLSLQTGDTTQATCRGVTRPYGTIINPSRLIDALRDPDLDQGSRLPQALQ